MLKVMGGRHDRFSELRTDSDLSVGLDFSPTLKITKESKLRELLVPGEYWMANAHRSRRVGGFPKNGGSGLFRASQETGAESRTVWSGKEGSGVFPAEVPGGMAGLWLTGCFLWCFPGPEAFGPKAAPPVLL